MPLYANITITIETGLSFQAGQFIQVIHDVNNYIFGEIVSYDSGTGVLVFTPHSFAGVGTFCSWTVVPSGTSGDAGTSGTSGTSGGTGGKVCTIASGDIVNITEKSGFNAVFYNYSVYDCTNYQAGNLIAVWNPTTDAIQYSNTTTASIGSTTGVSFDFTITGNDVNLIITTPDSGWKFSWSKVVLSDCCTVPVGTYIVTESGEYLTTESGTLLTT